MRALGLALLSVLLAAGCAGGDDGEGDEPTAAEIVSRSAAATREAQTFSFVYDVEGSGSSGSGLVIGHAEGEVAQPGRVRADVDARFGGIGLETELIVIDDRSWIEDPLTGDWREITGVLDAAAVFDPAEGVVSIIEGARDVELAGREQVEGTEAYHLTGKVPARDLTPIIGNPATDELVPADLWVGTEDFRIRRIEVHGPLSEDESDDTERTITVSDYDRPVEIEPPSG